MQNTVQSILPGDLYGLIGLLLIGVTILTSLIILSKSIKSIKLRTKNIEINATELQTKLGNVEKVTEHEIRDLIKREIEYATDYIMSYEQSVLDAVVRTYHVDKIKDELTYESVRLLARFALSKLTSRYTRYVTENHIGNTEEELENYCRIRSTQTYNFLLSFFAVNNRTLPSNFDVLNALELATESKGGLKEYLYVANKELFSNCNILYKTIRRS